MGARIRMHIRKGKEGRLEGFNVSEGTRITYAEARKIGFEDDGIISPPIKERAKSVVEAVYAKLQKQPVPYGDLIRLCDTCEIGPLTEEIRAGIADRAAEDGTKLRRIKIKGINDSYLALESRM